MSTALTIALVIAVVSSTLRIASARCDPGWTYFDVSDKCYKLFREQIMFNQANMNCIVAQGGHMASIHSRAENDFVRGLAHNELPIWIGYAWYSGEGGRAWSDHGKNTFDNWFDGRQPAYDPGQLCTKMLNDGMWKKNCCKYPPTGYVCQKHSHG